MLRKETSKPGGFPVEFYQMFEEVTPSVCVSCRAHSKERFPGHFIKRAFPGYSNQTYTVQKKKARSQYL